MSRPLLTEADLGRVRDAVAAAERRTSGEIVPYVVGESGRYDVAVWRGAALGAALAGGLALAVGALYDGWGLSWLYSAWAMEGAMLVGGTAGALVVWLADPLRRLLAGAGLVEETVHRRAAQAFADEEVFATRDRTGILLFVSMLEHRIEVVGDRGINDKVRPEEWAEVVDLLRGGIRRGDLAGGLVAAVDRCGDLLQRRDVIRHDDDSDELPDDVRLRER